MAKEIRRDYRYHVFGLVRGKKKDIEYYVAEGVSGACCQPITYSRKSQVAEDICAEHCSDSFSKRLNYLSFSFDPTCEKVVYKGDNYRTQRLSENEQMNFLRILGQELRELRKRDLS